MGDYGFKGAGEFGGRDENFNCLPDYYFTKCPYLDKLKDVKFSRKEYCKVTSSIEEKANDSLPKCDFCGDNYKQCPRFKK